MVLRILGCRIGGRNWLSKIGFKIEIPLPEHLLDSGGWKERRKRILEKGAEMLFARVLVAKFGAWDASFELIQRRRKGMFWFFEWMKEKDWNKAFESIWALEEFKNSRRKKAWGKKIGGNEMEIENGGGKSRAAVWDCEWFSEKEIGCDLARQRLKLRLWISFRNDPTRWKNLKKVPRTGGKKEKEWGDCEEKKQLSLFSWTTKNQITKGMHLKRFWIWFLHGKEVWGYIE